MTFTEDEALSHWCPQAQVTATAADDIVANTLSGRAVTCAGSNCMAWRWLDPLPDRDHPDFHRKARPWPFWNTEDDVPFAVAAQEPIPNRPSDVPADWDEILITGDDWENADGGEWAEPVEQIEKRYQMACAKRRGYCGLAGKP